MRQAAGFRCLLLLILFVGSVNQRPQHHAAEEGPKTVSLCELTKNWKQYNHRRVRIEAIYEAGFEISELYDVNCPTSTRNTAWVDFPTDVQKTTPREMIEKLNRLLRRNGRARVVAVGEFAGPKTVHIPVNTPPKFADIMRALNSRYGHQNQWRFLFVFSKIEKAEPVPASDPWPRWATKKNK